MCYILWSQGVPHTKCPLGGLNTGLPRHLSTHIQALIQQSLPSMCRTPGMCLSPIDFNATTRVLELSTYLIAWGPQCGRIPWKAPSHVWPVLLCMLGHYGRGAWIFPECTATWLGCMVRGLYQEGWYITVKNTEFTPSCDFILKIFLAFMAVKKIVEA